jgi:hypothetical protein
MSSVEKMTVFGGTKEKNEEVCCVIPGNDNNSPVLKIKENILLTMNLYKDLKLCAGTWDEHNNDLWNVDTSYPFSNILQCWGAYNIHDLEHFEEINNVFILGTLCKALCLLNLPAFEVIAKHKELFESFVEQSIAYYKNNTAPYCKDYKFSVERAMTSISNGIGSNGVGTSRARYILLNSSKATGVIAIGSLLINDYAITLTNNINSDRLLVVPPAIAYSELDFTTLNQLYDSMVWILFAKSGVTVDHGGNICFPSDFDDKRSYMKAMYLNHTVLNILSPIEIFKSPK